MKHFNKTHKKLSSIMRGKNYETEFGFVNLGYIYHEKDLWLTFKTKMNHDGSYNSPLLPYNAKDFWEDVQFAFEYRGDSSAGMKINDKQETKLKEAQIQYINELKLLISDKSKFLVYPNFESVTYYPVFWGYNVLFENKNNWYFVYGAASD